MAGLIEDLDFQVILKDDDFRKQIDADIAKANELNTSLSSLLEFSKALPGAKTIISKTGVKNAEDLAKALEKVKEGLNGLPDTAKEVVSVTHEHTSAVRETNAALGGTGDLMSTIAQLTGVAFSVVTVRRFLTEIVEITGAFEVQKMALGSMLQDLDRADEIFAELRKNALESPYTFQDLTKFAKQLTAFNIPTDQLVETEKRLADVAAGLGVDMGRIILAYGQVKAAGALKGQELRQFTEAGVPILEQLAKQIEEVEHRTVSLSEVFQRVSKKQISFEMVEEAFRRMTSEGGKFYNMQNVLVNTLQGKIGKLRDVWQQAVYDMGTANEGVLKGSVDAITNMVANLDELGKRLPEVVAAFGAFKAAQIASEVASNSFALANHKVLSALKSIGTWISKNPYAILAAAVVAVTFEAVRFYDELHAGQKRLETAIKENDKELDKEIQKLDELKAKLELAGRGTKEWQDAKDSVVAAYGKYFDGLDNEITKVGNLSTAYSTLKTNIEEAIRLRQYTAFEENERKILEDTMSGSLGKIRDRLYKKYSRAEAYTVMTELEQSLRTPGATFGSFMQNERVSNILKQGDYIGDIRQIFESEKEARKTYLDNVRTLIKEYGLQGTAVDVDFVGPLPMKATDNNSSETKTWGDANKKANETKERISDIQRETAILIRDLDKLKEAEKELQGEQSASEWAAGITGKTVEYFNNLEQSIANNVAELRSLGDAGNDAADAIEGRLGTDALTKGIKGLKEAKKSAEDFANAEKAIGDYLGKDFSMEGEKVVAKISKVLADLNTKNAGIDSNVTELVKKLDKERAYVIADYLKKSSPVANAMGTSEQVQQAAANAYWEQYKKDRIKEINAQAKQQKEQNEKLTKESIRGLGVNLFNEQMQGFELSNWSDKTIGELHAIRDALLELHVPDEIKQMLSGEQLQALEETLEKIGHNTIERSVDPATTKKWSDGLRKGSQYLSTAVSKLRELANISGDPQMIATSNWLERVSQNINAAADGFETAMSMGAGAYSWIGAVAGGLLNIAEQIVAAVMTAKNEAIQLAETLRKISSENQVAKFQEGLNKSGIFGEDTIGNIREYVSEMDRLQNKLNVLNASVPVYIDDRSDWNKLWDTPTHTILSLGELAASVGMDLYKDGVVDYHALQAILDAYPDMIQEAREMLQEYIDSGQKYESVLNKIKETMKSLFGDIADSAADAIIDGWVEAGDAALDYADILDGIARSYSKLLLKNVIYKSFLEPIEGEVARLFTVNDYEGAMELISGAMEKISDSAPEFEKILTAFDPYYKREGEEGDDSLGAGFKSLTEETGSLLASYANAMRADVSYMRGMQEKGFASVDALAQYVPTLNEYMAQIAANTYNTAEHTANILSELRSVIGAPGTDGSVVRVESYS